MGTRVGPVWIASVRFGWNADVSGLRVRLWRLNLSDTHSMERGLGCAAVIPAAWIGLAGLADYAGPQGWLGIAEFIGWIVVCVAAGLTVASLLRRAREDRPGRYISALLAVVLVAGFTYAPHWLGLEAPMLAKVIFTSMLQLVGTVATAALVFWVAGIVWSERRRP